MSTDLTDEELMISMGFKTFGSKAVDLSLDEINTKFKRNDNINNNIQPVKISDLIIPKDELLLPTNNKDNIQKGKDLSNSLFNSNNTNIYLKKSIENPYLLPISHEAVLPGHKKGITSLALDPHGSRLLSGSYDNQIMMWNFSGMDSNFRSFRSIEPYEGHPIEQIRYSESGDMFLCGAGHTCMKIYNREGTELGETIRGDMYILDLLRTKGHVAAITDTCWNPNNREQFLTCSLDGTFRIWNVNGLQHQSKVAKVKSSNKKLQLTACAYTFSGKQIIVGTNEGKINAYAANGKFIWTDADTQAAGKNSRITSIVMSSNEHTLFARGDDHTLSFWDLRKFKEPVKKFQDIPVAYEHSDLCLSPDEQVIVVASANSSTHSPDTKGQLIFIDRTNLDIIQRVNVGDTSLTRVLWNSEINQIVAGSTTGKIYMLYSTELSNKGAIICVGKGARKKNVEDFTDAVGEIYNPELYLEKEMRTKGKDWREERNKLRPELPNEMGVNSKSDSAQYSAHKFLIHDIVHDTMADMDPRKALLKFANKKDTDKPVFLQGYAKTQPVPIFDYSSFDNAEELEQKAREAAGLSAAEPAVKKFKINK